MGAASCVDALLEPFHCALPGRLLLELQRYLGAVTGVVEYVGVSAQRLLQSRVLCLEFFPGCFAVGDH
eukprot:660132-Prorocentrum_lima.AAC.1